MLYLAYITLFSIFQPFLSNIVMVYFLIIIGRESIYPIVEHLLVKHERRMYLWAWMCLDEELLVVEDLIVHSWVKVGVVYLYNYILFKAMDEIKRHDLSMAIFAPGWVYENQDKKNFFENQDRYSMWLFIQYYMQCTCTYYTVHMYWLFEQLCAS